MKSKYGFYKVGTGNFTLKVANVNYNKNEIIKLINLAVEKEINVLVFPELSLSGYTCGDLFNNKVIYDETIKSINEIKKIVPCSLIAFIGGVFSYHDKLFNVAYVLSNYELIGIIPKSYIPNYNEFYEKRRFNEAKEADFNEVIIDNKKVSFGTDLIFDGDEIKLGAEICEDLWVIDSPSNYLSLNGANVIVNLSASNDVISKNEYRENLVKIQSGKLYSTYIYSSSGFGESSQDLVFSGTQLIASEGTILNKSNDKKGLLESIIDVQRINNDRQKYKTSFESENKKSFRYIPIFSDYVSFLLPNKVNRHPFILNDKDKRVERSREIINLQAKSLATRLYNSRFNKVVIGISGGLDSTLALLVINETYNLLNLDKKNIYCFSLPGFGTSTKTFENAKKLIELIGATYKEIDIKETSSLVLKELEHKDDNYDVTYENVQARIRTLYLMNYSNMINGLVIGTGDLSEQALGFMTYNGDHMSMYAVNSSIPKTLVKVLVKDYAYINPRLEEVLESILNTPISPELVPQTNNSMQETEKIIGKYDLHDFFLYHFIRNGFSKEKIYELAIIAFDDIDNSYIKNTLDTFFARFFSQQFKRSCMPDGVKIGTVSLSPRGDLRMPSDIDLDNSFNKK